MRESKLVSIIIPTYKRADMLSRAINSVLNQTYKNLEVIVVDDNSPDTEYRKNTENVMDKYKDNPRVIYIKHEKNRNGAAARNTGIKVSKGIFIGFLDDDDFYYPDKIKKQVEFMNKHKDYNAVYCGVRFPDKEYIPIKSGDLSYELLSGTSLIYTISILAKKDALLKCGGWDESFRRHQEAVLMLRFFNCDYLIGVLSEPLCQVDDSDRSNVLNASENEKEMQAFLLVHSDNIDKCEEKKKGATKAIYAHRYLSVFLCYLKAHKLKEAILFYFKAFRKVPISFTNVFAKYLLNRIIVYFNDNFRRMRT